MNSGPILIILSLLMGSIYWWNYCCTKQHQYHCGWTFVTKKRRKSSNSDNWRVNKWQTVCFTVERNHYCLWCFLIITSTSAIIGANICTNNQSTETVVLIFPIYCTINSSSCYYIYHLKMLLLYIITGCHRLLSPSFAINRI